MKAHGLENGDDDNGFGDFGSFTAAEVPVAVVAPKAAASVAATSDGPRAGPLDLSLFGDDDAGLDNAPISLEMPLAPALAPAPAPALALAPAPAARARKPGMPCPAWPWLRSRSVARYFFSRVELFLV